MPKLSVIPPERAPAPPWYNPRRGSIILSRKAQMYLRHRGFFGNVAELMALRDIYLRARTAENIERISTWEMEHYGVEDALRLVKPRREKSTV